jgi:hypothetical protein
MNRVLQGRKVNAAKKIEIMSAVCIAVLELYSENVEKEYE